MSRIFWMALNSAVLKLGLATLLRVAKCLKRVAKFETKKILACSKHARNEGSNMIFIHLEQCCPTLTPAKKKFENPCLNCFFVFCFFRGKVVSTARTWTTSLELLSWLWNQTTLGQRLYSQEKLFTFGPILLPEGKMHRNV
jgi:hypothetical protein